MVECDEFGSPEEADHQASTGAQAPRELVKDGIEVVWSGMDEGVPGKHPAQARVVRIELAGVSDPVGRSRVPLTGVVDERWNWIDADNLQSVLVEVVRPLTWTAANIDDPAVNTLRPGEDVLAVRFRGVFDTAEQVNVLCRTRCIGVANGR